MAHIAGLVEWSVWSAATAEIERLGKPIMFEPDHPLWDEIEPMFAWVVDVLDESENWAPRIRRPG